MNEDRLKSLRLVEPSNQLRERIINTAQLAWQEATKDVAWWIPIRRLAVAAVAAAVMVSFADYAGDRAGMKWQIANEFEMGEPISDFDELGVAADVVLVRHLAVVSPPIKVSVIREYQEQVRQMLDEQG